MSKLHKINDYELLSKKVYHILKERILNGDFLQGGKLNETKIAKYLGVSRTPIREAIKGLAAEGLVKITPNQGVIVVNVSKKDLEEVLEIRRVLEGLAISIAAEKISQKEVAKLEEIINKMSIIISKPKPDIVAYIELNAKFHSLILTICGNNRLIKIFNDLNNSERRFRISVLRDNPGRLKYSLEEHQAIVEALKKKDSKKANRSIQKHIDSGLKNILEHDSKKRM